MEFINSRDNKTIKHISKLIKSSRYRSRENEFTVEGIRLCDDALRSDAKIVCLIYTESAYKKYTDKIDSFISASDRSYIVSDGIFSSICDTKTPQGVLFVVKALDKTELMGKINKENGVILALDSIQDPANLGTILRSAEAFGVDNVVLNSRCCDIYSPKVLRGSMGAVFRVNFFVTEDLKGFICDFNKNGTSYAAVLDSTSRELTDIVFDDNTLIAIGNEGNGLDKDIIDSCKCNLYIGMKGQAESLNASVAASIILWEVSKSI